MRMFAALLMMTVPAWGQSERDMQERLCAGMILEWVLPDGTRVDCLSGSHAIEVDWSHKWAEGIGQAMHYSSETGKEPGLILVCKDRQRTCERHYERARDTVGKWGIPLTIWECDLTAVVLDECATR